MTDCVFCKIIRGDIKNDFVASSNSFVAIRDIHPKSEGHTLIIPKEHYVTLLDIPDRLGEEMLSFIKKVAGGLLDEKYGDGFNVIMNNLSCAGQVVMHAHVHLVPRNEDDGLASLT